MTNPAVYAPSGTSINQNVLSSDLFLKAVESFVIEQFPNYHLINRIADSLGVPPAEQWGQRKVEIPRIGNTYPSATITNRALSGGVLNLKWQDPNSTPFRVDDLIESESGCFALCTYSIAGEANFIFQSGATDSATAFTSADFANGEQVFYGGNSPSVSSGKVGTTRRTTIPTLDYNYIPLFTDTASYTYQEASEKTFLKDGYWIQSAVMTAMRNVSEAFARNTYVGKRSNRNDRFYNDGFREQIKRAGGIIQSFQGELAENSITTFIDALKGNGAGGGSYIGIADYRYIGQFQRNVGKGYLTFAGMDNVLGGKAVDGLNVYHYAYNGITIDFVEEEMFANPAMFGEQVPQCYWFSRKPAELDGGKGTVPFMKSYKYGTADMFIGEMPGYMDKNGNLNNAGAKVRSMEYTTDIIYNKYFQLMNAASCGYHYYSA